MRLEAAIENVRGDGGRLPAAHPDSGGRRRRLGRALRACSRYQFARSCASRTTARRSVSCATLAWHHRSDRSQGSWCEPARQVLHCSGCADRAAVPARQSRPARHRAPPYPPAYSRAFAMKENFTSISSRSRPRLFLGCPLGLQLDHLALEPRDLAAPASSDRCRERTPRIVGELPHPIAQLRHVQVLRGLHRRTPRSLIRRTASSLNSRVNFRLSITHLQLHQNTNRRLRNRGQANERPKPFRKLLYLPGC